MSRRRNKALLTAFIVIFGSSCVGVSLGTAVRLILPGRTQTEGAQRKGREDRPENQAGTQLSPNPEMAAAYAPYWYVDSFTDSLIEVKNHLASELSLDPILTLENDRKIQLPAMTIPPLATHRLSLKSHVPGGATRAAGPGRWGDGSRRGSLLGSARLFIRSPHAKSKKPFSAWIVVEDPAERLGLVSMFTIQEDLYRSTSHGSWWLPFPDTHAHLAVQNPSANEATLHIQLLSNGHVTEVKPLRISPFGFQLLAVADLLKDHALPSVGSIRLASTFMVRPSATKDTARAEPIVSRVILIEEKHGFSVSLKMHPTLPAPRGPVPAELQSPVAYFGRLAKLSGRSNAYMHPHLLMSNGGEQPLTVRGTIYGRRVDGKHMELALKPIRIEPRSAIHADLEEFRKSAGSDLADGVAGLRLTHDGNVMDIVVDLINVDRTGDFSLYDHVTNMWLYDDSTLAAISFNLTGKNQSFLILKNTLDKPQRPRVILDYADGKAQYQVKLPEVLPQQVEVIDIRHLRDVHVPDVHGNVLPANTASGGAVVFAEPGAFVTSDPTFFYSDAVLSIPGMDPADAADTDRPHTPATCMVGTDGNRRPPPPPPPRCPQGYTEVVGASWFTCDEVDRGGGLACSVTAGGGQQDCHCAAVTHTLGHTNIIAIAGGRCGDIYLITTKDAGEAGAFEVTVAERPDRLTPLDMHQDVVAALGLRIRQGRYNVCIQATGRRDNRLRACPH